MHGEVAFILTVIWDNPYLRLCRDEADSEDSDGAGHCGDEDKSVAVGKVSETPRKLNQDFMHREPM